MNDSFLELTRGLSLYPVRPPGEMRALAHLAESLGYRNLWFGDSQNIWREAYVTMAAAAVGTERIIFGTGVTNAVTRHTSVVASAWATLAELTSERVAAGFGLGDSSLRTMGLQPTSLAALEGFIDDLRRLWSRCDARDGETETPYRLAYLARPLSIPVYMAASGPRMLRCAGRIADGVILLAGTDVEAVSGAIATVAAGATEAGRSLDDIHLVLWVPTALSPDPNQARDLVRAHVARTVLRPIQVQLSDEQTESVARIRERYDYYAHMEPGAPHSELVTDDLVDRFALAGTPTQCRDHVRNLAATGIDQVAIVPFAAAGDDISSTISQFAEATC